MTITVNAVPIGDAEIAAEMQYHLAPTAAAAHTAAAQALVVRELLVQEARRRGLDTVADNALDALLAGQVAVPEAGEDACRRYFAAHRAHFRTPELYEAHHI